MPELSTALASNACEVCSGNSRQARRVRCDIGAHMHCEAPLTRWLWLCNLPT